jgi:acetoin:2,6-dichlorophenolindophenol oxidoreductase subunit alpha
MDIEIAGELYRKVFLIRKFEERVYDLIMKGVVLGSVHLCIGEEASAVGTIAVLDKGDYILPTHRGHGQSIAKGADLKKLLAELAGKKTGYCRGNSGSVHIFDRENNNLGSNGIVGGQFPICVGAGLAIKNQGLNNCVAVFFGDGASNQGWFYEALNIASLWDLPIIFVCINNHYGMGTPYEKTSKAAITDKAKVFGISSQTVDGNDVKIVYEKMQKIVQAVKKERKPALLECKTYRWLGHSAFDKRKYRPDEELNDWKERDPVKIAEEMLIRDGVSKKEIEKINSKTIKDIDEAEKYAVDSEFPEFSEDMQL